MSRRRYQNRSQKSDRNRCRKPARHRGDEVLPRSADRAQAAVVGVAILLGLTVLAVGG